MSGAVMNERVGADRRQVFASDLDRFDGVRCGRGPLREMRIEWLTSRSAGNSVRCALHLPRDFITLLAESGRTRNGNCVGCKHGIPP